MSSRRVMEREMAELGQVRECRACGCTDNHACVGADGRPCHWVAADLCSACLEKAAMAPAREPDWVERWI